MSVTGVFGENTAWFAFKTTDVDRVRSLVFGGPQRDPAGALRGPSLADGTTWARGEIAVPSAELDLVAALLVEISPDAVAAGWSVDPNTLDERDAGSIASTCWAGVVWLP